MPRKRADVKNNHDLFSNAPPLPQEFTQEEHQRSSTIVSLTRSKQTPKASPLLPELKVYLHERTGNCSGVLAYFDFRPVVLVPSQVKIEGNLVKLTFKDGSDAQSHFCICGFAIECHCGNSGFGLSTLLFAQVESKSSSLISYEFIYYSQVKSTVSSLEISLVSPDDVLYNSIGAQSMLPLKDSKNSWRILSKSLRESMREQTVYPNQLLGTVRAGQTGLFRITNVNGDKEPCQLYKIPKDGGYFITLNSEKSKVDNYNNQPQRGSSMEEGVQDIDLIHPILKRHLLFPLLNPWCFFCEPGKEQLKRIRPPKGFLLHGPPGTGKTFSLRAIKTGLVTCWNKAEGRKQGWSAPEVAEIDVGTVMKLGGEHLVDVFNTAKKTFETESRMTLVIIDEIDAICIDRGEASAVNSQLTTVLLSMLDGVNSHPGVLVLATTNRPNALDEAIRRPGRLDREIEISVPSPEQRGQILLSILNAAKMNVTLTDGLEEAVEIARRAHGFVASDILAWVHKAIQTAQDESDTASGGEDELPDFRVYLERSLDMISPSALKELLVEIPKTSWADIGGYEDVKAALKESVEWPVKYWREFEALKLSPPKGILLYGPPGNSKTILAKAVACESSMNFIAVKGPEIFSKWVGESERMIRTIFRKARQHAPSVIFFDEVDALGGDRQNAGSAGGVQSRVLSQMLNEMSGIEEGRQVVVIGATNRPDLLDAALLRPGRFDRLIYVSLPEKSARRNIFKIHLKQVRLKDEESLLELVSERSEGYSGAEIAMLCGEVRMDKIRTWLKEGRTINQSQMEICSEDFIPIFERIKPRTPPDLLAFYEEYSNKRKM